MTAVTGIKRINAGKGHWYKVDGKKFDGVTTLIKQGRANGALIGWSAKQVAEYVADNLSTVSALAEVGREPLIAALSKVHQANLNKAAVRGTAVHALAERLTLGQEVEYPDELAGYVEAHVMFLDQWQVRPVLVEAVLANRTYGYAGTGDLIADVVLPGDVTPTMAPWLDETIPSGTKLRVGMDTKTSASGIWPDTAYQVSAYINAEAYVDTAGSEQLVSDLGIDHRVGFAIWTRSDGYDCIPLDVSPGTFRTFQFLATTARRVADDRRLVGSAVIPQESYR